MTPQARSFSALPPLPSLEHLKKQAKDLVTASRRGEPEAVQRLASSFPEQAAPYKLTQAQLVVAREHGAASWGRLRRAVLTALVERLAVRHGREWRQAAAAGTALAAAGRSGLVAALEGLSHPDPRVRRGATAFLDHHADDRCVPKLAELALHDPVPYVRRTAVHALICQRCKPSPLGGDLVPLLVMVAREDPTPRVRFEALYGLGGQPRDTRARAALEAALRTEPNAKARGAAHAALKRQSPEYRALAAQRARAASLARAVVKGAGP
jgi:HEAT repeat protein